MKPIQYLLIAILACVVGELTTHASPFPTECPDPTPVVAPERFVVTNHHQDPTCTFAPDGQPLPGCDEMDVPVAWNQSPYQINFLVKRALIVVHGSGSDAVRSEEIVRNAAAQLALLPNETIIIAPQFTEDDDIPVDGLCGFASCVGGVKDGIDCNEQSDCASPEIAYWGGGWRWGWRNKSGGVFERPFRLSSFEVVDQVIRQLTNGKFPGLSQIVVAGHSAGGQFVSRYAAATSIGSEINVPMRYVSSAPGKVLYLDNQRRNPGSDPSTFGTPVFDCNCPAYSDVTLSGYNDYPYGLENRDLVDNGNNPYLEDPTDQDFRDNYRIHEVVHIVGEYDTCKYSSAGECPQELDNCQICFDPCGNSSCPSECGAAPPSCKTAIQGADHIETAFVYRDHVVDHYGPEILAKHRFEMIPCIGHWTCGSWQSFTGKKHLFDHYLLIDGFDWLPGPLINGWLDSPDNVNGNLINVNGEIAPSTPILNLAGAYRPVPVSHGLRIRARIKETDASDLSGGRFEHFFMAYSHGVRTSGYGVGVERTGSTAGDSRITLYENGLPIATALSTFQFQAEVELEFAVYSDGRIEGSVVEGDDVFTFSFAERPIASSGIHFMYHTTWAAPGSTTPPRLDFVTLNEIPTAIATPPGASRTMTVDKLDPSGSALSIAWDTSCPSAEGYHLV